MRAEKRAVAGSSVLAALFITGGKIAVGITTGSSGILSEQAHSALDLIAAVLTYLSVGVSDKPADADHQYGHGKVENFSAFVETGLLLITCAWVIYEAIMRLFFRPVEVEPSIWAFGVMLVSMAVDLWRSRSLARIATKYESQALEADALHFSTDVWSAGVVVFGLMLILVGRKYHLDWLGKADLDHRLIRRGRDHLSKLAALASHHRRPARCCPGRRPRPDHRCRIAHRRCPRNWSRAHPACRKPVFRRSCRWSRPYRHVQRSEQLVEAVTQAVRRILPDADVTVQPLPRAERSENIFDRIRAVATRHNLNVHDISVQDLSGRLHVEQHVELDERLSLKSAHDLVTELEADMRRDVREIDDILTHIESEPATIETGDELVRDAGLERQLKSLAAEFPEIVDMHDVQIKKVRGRL